MSVSIFDVAIAQGAAVVEGGVNGAEFQRLGLPMLSGCELCHATLGPGNAYPTRTDFIQCGECVEMTGMGFDTVEAFEAYEKDGTGAHVPTEKWLVLLEVTLKADPDQDPAEWRWQHLLDLAAGEDVLVKLATRA